MPESRACVLSIAGYDPCGGAGLLADVKTFEANKVLGMGIVTALTFQNESEFSGLQWIEEKQIAEQINLIEKKYRIAHVKIGMIRDLNMLEFLLRCLEQDTGAKRKIIWDPVMGASAGFTWMEKVDSVKLPDLLKKLYLITPNTEEVVKMTGESDPMKASQKLSGFCNVYLTGGHLEGKDQGRDFLFTTEGKMYPFRAKSISQNVRHGSGCVLSSAITAHLAKGYPLHAACLRGKNYVTRFMFSGFEALGYHKL